MPENNQGEKMQRLDFLRKKKRLLELRQKQSDASANLDPIEDKYQQRLPSSTQEAAKWWLGRAGQAVEFVDQINPAGAPARKAYQAAQEGKDWYGDDGVIREYFGQFGEPASSAPRAGELFEKAGVPAEANITSPLIFNPFDPEAQNLKMSPAGILGGATEAIADPLNFVPIVGQAKWGGQTAKIAEKYGPKIAAKFDQWANSRAIKQGLGSNVSAHRRAMGMPSKGVPNPAVESKGVERVGSAIRELPEWDTRLFKTGDDGKKTFSPQLGLPTTKKLGEGAAREYSMVGEMIGKVGEYVDLKLPKGSVDAKKIAADIRSQANAMSEYVPGYDTTKQKLEEIALRLDEKDFITFAEAQKMKDGLKFNPTSSDAFMSNQKAVNSVNRTISGAMEDAAETAGKHFGETDPIAADLAADYTMSKDLYGPLKETAMTSTERSVRDRSNRMFSPSDIYVGGTGALAGSMGGDMGDAGAIAIAAGLGNQLLRKFGNSILVKANQALKSATKGTEKAITKYGKAFEQAAVAGNSAVVGYHHLLMNNDPEYRKAVEMELTNVTTEPFNTIGNVIDTVGMGQIAFAGVAIPMAFAKMLKSGSLLSAAAKLKGLNKGEDIKQLEEIFVHHAKKENSDLGESFLRNLFRRDNRTPKGNAEGILEDVNPDIIKGMKGRLDEANAPMPDNVKGMAWGAKNKGDARLGKTPMHGQLGSQMEHLDKQFRQSGALQKMSGRDILGDRSFGVTVKEYIEAFKRWSRSNFDPRKSMSHEREADEIYNWHKRNGSLDDEI